jgi:hypothetical protein
MTQKKVILSEEMLDDPVEEISLVDEDVEEVTLDTGEDDDDDDAKPVDIDDLPDDQELWEDGPTVKDFKAWKEAYSEVYITVISLPNNNVVWRPLEREEYRDHVKRISLTTEEFELDDIDSNFLSDELVAEKCIIFPEYKRSEQKKGLAGVPTLIAQQVMEASGFSSIDVRKIA